MYYDQRQASSDSTQAQGIELGSPSLAIDLILPLSIVQCEHFIVFYNITPTSVSDSSISYPNDAAIQFTNIDESSVFFSLSPPIGVGYIDWECNVPAGHSFTAWSFGGGYSYTVGDGSSECLDAMTTTSFTYASYSAPIFTTYTAAPTIPTVLPTQTSLMTVDFPTDTELPTITVPTGVFLGPTNAARHRYPSVVHKIIIIAYIVGAILILLLPICCYRRFFGSLYSRIFGTRQETQPVHPTTHPDPEEAEVLPTHFSVSHPIIPDLPPLSRNANQLGRSHATVPVCPPIEAQPNPMPNLPPVVTDPQPIRPIPRHDSSSSGTHPAPLSVPVRKLVLDPTITPSPPPVPTKDRPRPLHSTKYRIPEPRIPPRPRNVRPLSAREPTPDELAAIKVLASMNSRKLRLMREPSNPNGISKTSSYPENGSSPPSSSIDQIRQFGANPAERLAVSILNKRGPDQRRALVAAILERGRISNPETRPAISQLTHVPLPPAAHVIVQPPQQQSAFHDGNSDELEAVDIMASLTISQRRSLVASALRQSGSSQSHPPASHRSSAFSPIDKGGMSRDKLTVVDLLESMSADERDLLVRAALQHGRSSKVEEATQGYEL